MSIQVKKLHAALKHGAYSATAVLPGEDLAAFKKLHQECIAHYAPVGPLEDDVVPTMARLLWRKQNLPTCRLAELALEYEAAIRKEKLPNPWKKSPNSEFSPADVKLPCKLPKTRPGKSSGPNTRWSKSVQPRQSIAFCRT